MKIEDKHAREIVLEVGVLAIVAAVVTSSSGSKKLFPTEVEVAEDVMKSMMGAGSVNVE